MDKIERLKELIRQDIECTVSREGEYVMQENFSGAFQQQSFRAALERVMTHIRVMERLDDEKD